MIVAMVAERMGRPESDFELQAFSWALTGLLQAVVTAWIDSDGELDSPTCWTARWTSSKPAARLLDP
jgi:hypothetical protein